MPKILTAPRMARCIGCDSCMLACARMIYRSISPHKSAIQIRSRGGVMGRMVANICTACAEPVPCVEVCPTEALTRGQAAGVWCTARPSASAATSVSRPALSR